MCMHTCTVIMQNTNAELNLYMQYSCTGILVCQLTPATIDCTMFSSLQNELKSVQLPGLYPVMQCLDCCPTVVSHLSGPSCSCYLAITLLLHQRVRHHAVCSHSRSVCDVAARLLCPS